MRQQILWGAIVLLIYVVERLCRLWSRDTGAAYEVWRDACGPPADRLRKRALTDVRAAQPYDYW